MNTASLYHPSVPDTRRYWAGVGVLVALLLAASVGLALNGRNPRLRARALLPAPGSTVSVRPALEVHFVGAVDKGSVEGLVRIVPEVPFDLAWSESRLRILPRVPLRPETEYAVSIGPGVRTVGGDAMRGELAWRFRTRTPRVAFLRFVGNAAVEMWVSDLGGGNPYPLSAPGQNVQTLTAAPDGSSIVYTVEETATNSVNLWRAGEQGGLTRLTAEPGVIFSAPHFNPTGDLLAVEVRPFVTIGDQGSQLAPPRLELRRPSDGSPAGAVYGGSGAIGHSPRWSPDGTRLAFYEAAQGALAVFNFTPDLLFFPSEGATLGEQPWSPDGRAVVYSSVAVGEQSAQQGIALRDLGMGTEVGYSGIAGDQSDPAWSPDGAWIAYAFRPPPGGEAGSGIWLLSADGTQRVPVTTDPNAIFSAPLWSPDGDWLLFSRFDANAGTQSIWAARRDGSNLHPLAPDGFLAVWVP